MRGAATRAFGTLLLLLTAGLSISYAQSDSDSRDGTLNRWTTETVSLQKQGGAPEFLSVRFGRHKGYDRAVFEFKGELTTYAVGYGEPPFQGEASLEPVKVRGRFFVAIGFYPVDASWDKYEMVEKRLAEPAKLKMPVIRDAQVYEWFEGELDYVIGLRRKSPFRVQVLSNPTRLVVDFKR